MFIQRCENCRSIRVRRASSPGICTSCGLPCRVEAMDEDDVRERLYVAGRLTDIASVPRAGAPSPSPRTPIPTPLKTDRAARDESRHGAARRLPAGAGLRLAGRVVDSA